MIEDKDMGVSILCLAYNHEKYIADAIEGFLKQKTTFPYEIIIHDDASTDKTASVIKEYEARYPDIIKPIFQTENQYSKGVSINNKFFLPAAKGKYVALCDGDDYWTDPLKLQKQYDALEANPNCLMCLHRVWDYNSLTDATQAKKQLPKNRISTGVVNSRDFLRIIGSGDFFNEVCYFFNADSYKKYQSDYPSFAKKYMKNKTDDMPMLLYFGNMADVYYIDEEMAVYRRFNTGSWSDSHKQKSREELRLFFQNSVDALAEFNDYSNKKYETEINYICRYFEFNRLACDEEYNEMLRPEYDCVWDKQSKKYRKRIELLGRNKLLWKALFRLYDWLRQ